MTRALGEFVSAFLQNHANCTFFIGGNVSSWRQGRSHREGKFRSHVIACDVTNLNKRLAISLEMRDEYQGTDECTNE